MRHTRTSGKRLRIGAAVIGLVAALLAITPGAAHAAGPAVFINELHYDNTGADSGEAVEVAGPAGTDLTGWSIVLYNGSGGAVYGTESLSGVLPDQQAGFGTLSFPKAGIQNGSPDGLALVDASATVVQFLSYEGTFIAVGGPADGMTSTDIGVTEPGSGPVGDSLQLTGNGTRYGDFTWAGSQPSTFGTPNTGQTFGGSVPSPDAGDLVVNEIDYDQPGTRHRRVRRAQEHDRRGARSHRGRAGSGQRHRRRDRDLRHHRPAVSHVGRG